jgi:hypothetical protein
VVTPVAIIITQFTSAAMAAFPATITSDAVAVPELVAVAVNVVVPHPLVAGVARLENVKVGRTNVMVSPDTNNAFNEKAKDNDVAAAVTGFAIVNVDAINAGDTMAVESSIGVAAMF